MTNEWHKDEPRPPAATFSRWTACKLSHPSVTDELVNEKEKYKNIADEMDQAFSELSGF